MVYGKMANTEILPKSLNFERVVPENALFQKKSTPPQRKACWKISREGG